MKKKKILIIEDDEALLAALKDSLSEVGLDILVAGDGEEGLKLALGKHPDLIILDLILPRKNGVRMLEDLRKDKWGKEALVLVLTNVGETDSVPDLVNRNLGVDREDYLLKTENSLEDIIRRVNEKLGLGHS